MIFLTSSGFVNPKVFRLISENKDAEIKSACVITTGIIPDKEKHPVAQHTKYYLTDQGVNEVDFLDIENEDPAAMLQYDLIVMLGGNSNHLFYHLKKSGTDTYILKAIEQGKDIVAASAGAWFLAKGRQYADIFSSFVGIDETYGFPVNNEGLNIIPEHIFPHYDMFCERVESLEEKLSLIEKEYLIHIIRLKEADFIYKDNKGDIVRVIE